MTTRKPACTYLPNRHKSSSGAHNNKDHLITNLTHYYGCTDSKQEPWVPASWGLLFVIAYIPIGTTLHFEAQLYDSCAKNAQPVVCLIVFFDANESDPYERLSCGETNS